MNKILKNGLLIIIVMSVMTYLIMGLTSIYRNNINKHDNLLNNSGNNSSNSNNNNSSSTKPSQTVKVTGVSLSKTSAEIYLNNDTGFSVSATVSPSNATNKNVT